MIKPFSALLIVLLGQFDHALGKKKFLLEERGKNFVEKTAKLKDFKVGKRQAKTSVSSSSTVQEKLFVSSHNSEKKVNYVSVHAKKLETKFVNKVESNFQNTPIWFTCCSAMPVLG